jgi:hypothetical protein
MSDLDDSTQPGEWTACSSRGRTAGLLNGWWRAMPVLTALLVLIACSARRAAADTMATAPLYWSSPIAVDPGFGFYGISCPSTSLCVTADDHGNIATSTNPTAAGTWSLANIESLELTMVGSSDGGVSCASTSLCVVAARGEIVASTTPTGGTAAWTIAVPGYEPDTVSCASSTLCVAGGREGRVLTATDPTGGTGSWTATQIDGENTVEGVSCSLPTLCVAVDDDGDILTSTNPTGGAGAWTISRRSAGPLYSVSCVASELCFAAGPSGGQSFVSTDPTGAPGIWTLTEEVDGSGGVSCAASTLCVAAQNDTNSGISDSADPAGGTSAWHHGEPGNVGNRFMDGVSCPSTGLCLAAGAEGDVFAGAPAHRLSVSLSGTGAGYVTSTPISCPFDSCSHPGPRGIEPQPITVIECSDAHNVLMPNNDCALGFPVGGEVTLTAIPASGSMFDGWAGACSGHGSCTVTMIGDTTADANFVPFVPATGRATIARISSLRESNSSFAVAGRSTPLTGHTSKRHHDGTLFSFDIDQAATVNLAITTTRPGRRSGHSCKRESRPLRHKPRCTRTITVATLTRTARMGPNAIAFTGRVPHKALPPGHYKASLTAKDEAGTSPKHTLGFEIVAR